MNDKSTFVQKLQSRHSASLKQAISFVMLEGAFTPRLGFDVPPDEPGVSTIPLGRFEADDFAFGMEKTVLFGPREDEERLVIGIFAGIHGDEPVGPRACERLYLDFLENPQRYAGYELHLYPGCNPWGLLFSMRKNALGHDLNRRFWSNAQDPEIRILERELEKQRYDGLISLHADDTSRGVYGYTQGRQINRDLLRPALMEAAGFFPVNLDPHIDGFHATDGMIEDCFPGVLRPPPARQGHPFEIIFETPGKAAHPTQTYAAVAAVRGVLSEYKRYLAKGWGI